MELMFSKLPSLERETAQPGTNGVEASNGRQGDDPEESLTMEPVAVQRFEASLSGGHWGIHGYVPVTFSGVHFVRVDCMVRPRWQERFGGVHGGSRGRVLGVAVVGRTCLEVLRGRTVSASLLSWSVLVFLGSFGAVGGGSRE